MSASSLEPGQPARVMTPALAVAGLSTRGSRLVAFGIAAALAATAFGAAVLRSFHADECESIHTAWKILQGETIYTGFFQHHHPLFYYSLVPLVGLAGESVTGALFASRAYAIALGALNLWLTWRLSLGYLRDRTAAACSVALLLLCMPFTFFGFQVRPDGLMLTFELLAAIGLQSFLSTGRPRALVGSAVSLGLAFLALQKAAPFAAVVLGLLGLEWLLRRVRLVHALAYAGVLALTLAPFYGLLAAQGMLRQYLLVNWSVNQLLLQATEPAPLILQGVLLSLPCTLFFLLGLGGLRRHLRLWHAAVLALGTFVAAAAGNAVFLWYLIPAFPFMAVLGGEAAARMLRDAPRLSRAALLAAVPVVGLYAHVHASRLADLPRFLAFMTELNALSAPGEVVFDASEFHFNLFRRDPDYFWYNVPTTKDMNTALPAYQQLAGYRYDPYEIIERTRPRWIWAGAEFLDTHRPELPARYAPTHLPYIWLRKDDGAGGTSKAAERSGAVAAPRTAAGRASTPQTAEQGHGAIRGDR